MTMFQVCNDFSGTMFSLLEGSSVYMSDISISLSVVSVREEDVLNMESL